MLGGLIGLVQKSGGALGLAKVTSRFASTPLKAQLLCWFLGVVVFFDDYASILIVGNALRPILKHIKVSKEKFAFIIHTMAVCLCSFSPISSWVGIEIGKQ